MASDEGNGTDSASAPPKRSCALRLAATAVGLGFCAVGLIALLEIEASARPASNRVTTVPVVPMARRNLSSNEVYRKCAPAVVSIVAFNRRGREFRWGSGFFISRDGLVVTNAHVIKDAAKLALMMGDDTLIEVERVAVRDDDADLALLKIEGIAPAFLGLAPAAPSVGDRVYAIGNPHGLSNTLSEGIVSAIRPAPGGGGPALQTTAPISGGSSGGPLISEDGDVLGVTTQFVEGGQNLNFAVSAPHVARLLRENAATRP